MKVKDAIQILRNLISDDREADCRDGNFWLTDDEREAIRIASDYLEEMP